MSEVMDFRIGMHDSKYGHDMILKTSDYDMLIEMKGPSGFSDLKLTLAEARNFATEIIDILDYIARVQSE